MFLGIGSTSFVSENNQRNLCLIVYQTSLMLARSSSMFIHAHPCSSTHIFQSWSYFSSIFKKQFSPLSCTTHFPLDSTDFQWISQRFPTESTQRSVVFRVSQRDRGRRRHGRGQGTLRPSFRRPLGAAVTCQLSLQHIYPYKWETYG